jgi:anti-sigma factor RsiW
MEKPSVQHDERLLDYLDGKLSDAAARELKVQLEQSPALATRLEELRAVHGVLTRNKIEEPSSNFTHRVMANLHRYPELIRTSPKTGLLLILGTMVGTIILALLISGGVFDTMNVPVALDKIPASRQILEGPIVFSGKWIMNGLIVLNLVIGFIILDQTVLRPYFGKRSRLGF